MDILSVGVSADSDAGLTAHPVRNTAVFNTAGFHTAGFHTAGFDTAGFDTDPAVTTDHLRRLWEAGGRSITVTYDEQAVRHRAYLAHPRTDI